MELKTPQIMEIFNVSYMTVYLWREGATDKKPLPYHTRPKGTQRNSVYFKWREVKKWAQQNNVRIAGTPAELKQASTR